jgi:hypothetical protein
LPHKREAAVFISIDRSLPADLTWMLLNSLQLSHVSPSVYHGIPRPQGSIVTSTYVEARNQLLASDLVILVLRCDPLGRISDDWSLAFMKEVRVLGARIVLCLVRTPYLEPADSRLNLSSTVGTSVVVVDDISDISAAVRKEVVAFLSERKR